MQESTAPYRFCSTYIKLLASTTHKTMKNCIKKHICRCISGVSQGELISPVNYIPH